MNKIKGFTLIELMIVVAVIAVLAMIAVPSYQNYITKSKIKEAQSNLIALSLSAENFYQRTLNYPIANLSNSAALKSSTMFSTWNPTSDTFSYQYQSTDGSTYTLKATGTDSRVVDCQLSLNHQGTRTATGCGNTEWTN